RRAPLELRLRPRISRIDCTCVDGAIHVNISVIFSTNISVSTAIAWHGGHRCSWCAWRGWHLVHLCIFLASLPPRPRRRLLGLVHQRSLHVLSATRCGYYCTCCRFLEPVERFHLEVPSMAGKTGSANATGRRASNVCML